MSDLYITHKETYSFSQSKLGREYAKKIADVWRGEGLIVDETETTGAITVSYARTVKQRDYMEVQDDKA